MVSLVSSVPGLLGDHSFLPFLLLNGPAHSSLFSPVWSPWDSSLESRSPPLPLEVHFPNKAAELLFPNYRPGLASPCISVMGHWRSSPIFLFVTRLPSVLRNLITQPMSLRGMSILQPSGGVPCIPEEVRMWSSIFVEDIIM